MVIVGNVEPGNVPLNPAMAILKELEFIGSAHATLSDLEAVLGLMARGAIAPDVAASFPIADAAAAHAMMETRKAAGRVVLVHDDAG